jgi:hypothetical protein
MTNQLQAGQRLNLNDKLVSPNGRYSLWMQPDGNLVLYDGPLTSTTAYWATGTWTLPPQFRPTHADIQNDGHFVLYNDAMHPAWGSGIWGAQYGGAKLVLQDDGNLVIYLPNGSPLWATNTVRVAPQPAGEIPPHREAIEVGWGKKMDTTATLYRNGTLTVESYQRNDNWWDGLRGRILVLCIDAQGNNIWISDVLECPTRCSIPDVSCASYGTMNFVNNFPEAVGKYTTRLDILQADNPNYVDLRNQFIDAAKAIGDVAIEVKNQWDRLTKS